MKVTQANFTRRDFLFRASLTAAAVPLASFGMSRIAGCAHKNLAHGISELELIKANAITAPDCNWCGAKDVPANVAWKTVLTKDSDRGAPLIIAGTVFQPDGKTPAPNTLIYLYHTDAEGYYGRKGEIRHGKHRGWMLTDNRGRYEFRSIKPAPYPQNKYAAHIHFTLTGKNFKEDWIDSILFEGDELITQTERNTAGEKGGFNPILKLEKGADGILRGVRDIRLWQA